MNNLARLYKTLYPGGTRIELISMKDEYSPINPGTKGTVVFVDCAGNIHMKWDDGRTLAIIPTTDRFKKIGKT